MAIQENESTIGFFLLEKQIQLPPPCTDTVSCLYYPNKITSLFFVKSIFSVCKYVNVFTAMACSMLGIHVLHGTNFCFP